MKTVSPIDFWLTLLCTPSSDKKMIIPTQEDQEKMSQPLTLLTNKNKKHFAKKWERLLGIPLRESFDVLANILRMHLPQLSIPSNPRWFCLTVSNMLRLWLRSKSVETPTKLYWTRLKISSPNCQPARAWGEWTIKKKIIRIKKNQIWSSKK